MIFTAGITSNWQNTYICLNDIILDGVYCVDTDEGIIVRYAGIKGLETCRVDPKGLKIVCKDSYDDEAPRN